ncbi:MAG TPA: GNAT family N-acetyltransferase [Pyrinomonadaceae bacterium]|jgi:ribosomal-protein-alanine N-acetyltransferase
MLLPKIETERLLLRMYRPDELEDVYRLITDRDVQRFLPDYSIEKEEVLTSLPRRLERWRERGFAQLGVFEKDTEKLTGYCGLQYLDETPEVEIYYGFFKEFRGKGYATEAAKALLRFGFEEATLEKIVGATHPENFPSQNVLKRIGLNREKELRHLYGEDSVYFSLLRADYKPGGAAKYDLSFTETDD